MDCITNIGNLDFKFAEQELYDNFFATAYMKSACDFYGAYLGLELVRPLTDKRVVTRRFGSAAYGNSNNHIFRYYSNLFDKNNNSCPSAYAVKKYLWLIKQRKPTESVVFFCTSYYVVYYWKDAR